MPETVRVSSASSSAPSSVPATGPEVPTVTGSPTPTSRVSAAERLSTISESALAALPSSSSPSWPGGSIAASKKPLPEVELASR